MDTFLRLKKILVSALGIQEKAITLEATLGDLFDREERPCPNPQMRTQDSGQDSIVDALSPDSLDLVELLMWLEDGFDLKISDEEAKQMPGLMFDRTTTVQQMVDWLDNHARG